MHHQRVDFASLGDVMVYQKDTTLGQTRELDTQVQVLDVPDECKAWNLPIGLIEIE